MLEKIIIVDSVAHRAKEIQETVKDKARQVQIIELRKDEIDAARLCFAREVYQILSERKPLMVIFNMVALTKTNVIEILKSIEKMEKVGSRRIFVSCEGSRSFKEILQEKRLDPKEFRRVGYDEEGRYLRKIRGLFREQTTAPSPQTPSSPH